MLRSDQLGVTSVIRDLALAPACYESLIHFFRSSAYNLDSLREQWYRCGLMNAPLFRYRNRIILVGDGVKQSKEARKMPGVKKMTQESETCSKPQFIHGHLLGAIGVIASTKAKRFCIPLRSTYRTDSEVRLHGRKTAGLSIFPKRTILSKSSGLLLRQQASLGKVIFCWTGTFCQGPH